MKASRLVLAMAVMGALVFTMTPGHAARRVICVLSGGVTLNGPANLVTTVYGSGSFAPSSLLQCTGAVGGKGSAAGSSFSFCQHNVTGPNPACHGPSNNGPTPQLDKLYDVTNQTPFKIVAHALGTASFQGFTGGVSCSLSFQGHAYGTVAELVIKSFVCSNGFHSTGTNHAVAAAVPVINNVSNCPPGPGNVKLCFRTLQFLGTIVVSGP